MMRLVPQLVPKWPKLAWLARFEPGANRITVYHGPMVEVADEWIVEAVWAGDFASGDFDKTDLVVGTGIRNRGDRIVFVSSGTAVDRLWHCVHLGQMHISNSLAALLAVADLSLADDYEGHVHDIETIDEPAGGLSKYVRQFRTTGPAINVLYYNNLVFGDHTLQEVPKPDVAPHFGRFEQYLAFLEDTARAMGKNARCQSRTHPVVPQTTVSSGYDSGAIAVIAKRAGCEQAVTIDNATSFWRGSDSGEEVARSLGIPCRVYRHTPRAYTDEVAVWAAIGRPRGLNYTIFDFPGPVCLWFTGNYGDKIWDLSYPSVSEPTGDLSGLCMCEFRLIRGVLHCMPAWWGIRRSEEIRRISFSEEMAPWTLHNNYDRPIARRILEESGVPRGTFAVRKKNTSSEAPFWWPYSAESQASLARYLQARGHYAPSPLLVQLIRRAAHLEHLFYMNVTRKLGLETRVRPWANFAGSKVLFQWANEALKQRYRAGLADAAAGRGD